VAASSSGPATPPPAARSVTIRSACAAAGLLRGVRPSGLLGRTNRRLAVDLVGEVHRLDRRIAAVGEQISAAVEDSGTSLTRLFGVGDLVAAKILARVGQVDRFPTAAQFASYAGVAPIEVSSGDVVRHRLSRAGDRQLNYARHIIAITQIRGDTDGRAYYQRKRQEGKSHREALRACEAGSGRCRLPPAPARPADRAGGGSGRTSGGDSAVQRGRLNPDSRLFGQVTSRTRHRQPTTSRHRAS
jgi:transposase